MPWVQSVLLKWFFHLVNPGQQILREVQSQSVVTGQGIFLGGSTNRNIAKEGHIWMACYPACFIMLFYSFPQFYLHRLVSGSLLKVKVVLNSRCSLNVHKGDIEKSLKFQGI